MDVKPAPFIPNVMFLTLITLNYHLNYSLIITQISLIYFILCMWVGKWVAEPKPFIINQGFTV